MEGTGYSAPLELARASPHMEGTGYSAPLELARATPMGGAWPWSLVPDAWTLAPLELAGMATTMGGEAARAKSTCHIRVMLCGRG